MYAFCGSKVFHARRLAAALALAAPMAAHAVSDFYQPNNLVSDGTVTAKFNDSNLVNSWGIAFNPFGPVWVADNGAGVSTLYDGTGKPQPAQALIVQIPAPAGVNGPGTPTGIVFNASTGFIVSKGSTSGASRFIFATEDGVIAGWAPTVDMTHAILMVDNSKATGAVYKGLALGAGGQGSLLYAADFHNNRIDVFDSSFKPVTLSGSFADPSLPAGFAPFGLQAINGDIYVSYAQQDQAKHDDVAGKGNGFVNVFDPNGHLIKRLVSRGSLNSPWGLTVAPAGFGRFSGRLLVGNFGDGRIHAYDAATGQFVGTLRGADKTAIQIPGLWGLAFGNGFASQPVDTLFFASGPGDEKHGLYGSIDIAPGDEKLTTQDVEGVD